MKKTLLVSLVLIILVSSAAFSESKPVDSVCFDGIPTVFSTTTVTGVQAKPTNDAVPDQNLFIWFHIIVFILVVFKMIFQPEQ